MSCSLCPSAAMIVNGMDSSASLLNVGAPRFSRGKSGTAATGLVGESEHILCGPSEAVQGRDDEGVACVESGESSIEVARRCASAGDAVADIALVTMDASVEEADFLPVSAPLARRYARVADQLRRAAPGGVS